MLAGQELLYKDSAGWRLLDAYDNALQAAQARSVQQVYDAQVDFGDALEVTPKHTLGSVSGD